MRDQPIPVTLADLISLEVAVWIYCRSCGRNVTIAAWAMMARNESYRTPLPTPA